MARPPSRSATRLDKYLRDLRTLPSDAATGWRREGWVGLRAELLERTVFRLFRRGRYLVIEQDLASFRKVAPPPGVRIEVFDGGDWSPFIGLATSRKLRFYQYALERERTCLVAWRDGRLVGYTWISERMEPAIEVYPLPLPRDAAYLWDVWVPGAQRGSGIGSALVSARLSFARERGYRRGWRMIAPGNAASLRTLDRTSGPGTRILGEVRYIKVLARMRICTTWREATAEGAAAGGQP